LPRCAIRLDKIEKFVSFKETFNAGQKNKQNIEFRLECRSISGGTLPIFRPVLQENNYERKPDSQKDVFQPKHPFPDENPKGRNRRFS